MSDFSVKMKGYVEQTRDYTLDKIETLKSAPSSYWLKNSPAIIIIMITIVYLIFVPKGESLGWGIFFLIGLAYAAFALNYWKKDSEFSLYWSLAVLFISLPFAGYEWLTYLLTTLYDKIL
ncbi:hypothetical protein [Aquisalibacillus elongatus]|uniref:Uncharacterized protein n=1 Tax=Aquisalibacillus elongatus TaxID=485577 RepID=A0A3N5C1X4_9BACI|nr:hypothetical protein [Aquisalibacillus elongatus]RPF53362.1 hypothetical protein EDC24_1861 [Aquisalibacillus elongatus]